MTLLCGSARHAPDAPREPAPGLMLCWTCRDDIVRYTQAALDVHGEQLDRQAWGAGTSYAPRVRETRERQLVIDPGKVERRTEIGHVLGSWARLVLDERGFAPLRPRADELYEYLARGRVSIAARIITTSATWLAAHPEAASCRDELRGLVVQTPSSVWYPVGVCPTCGDVALGRGLGEGAAEVACSADADHRWVGREWAGQWLRQETRELTTAEAAALLGVSVDSVRKYAAIGRLTRLGTVRRALFDRAEVERLHVELWG